MLVEPGHQRGQQRRRGREVGVDAEVTGDPVKDLVDVERPDRRLELGGAPPIVPLERMVAQIDHPVSAGHRSECLLVDAAGETGDPFGKARLGEPTAPPARSRHRFCRPSAIRAWTTGSETTKSPSPKEIGAT